MIGVKGSGKTHLVKSEILPAENPVLIYDTIGEYEDQGFAEPESLADLLDLIEISENIRVEREDFDFETICMILCNADKHYTMVVDEFHVLYEHHMSFQSDVPSFKNLVLLGNHNNVSTIVITQRPTDLPKFILSQASALYCFHVWLKPDREFLACVVDDVDQFKNLELYHYKRVKLVAPIEVSDHVTTL